MPLVDDHVGRAMPGDAEEEVVRHLAAIVEHRDAACRVERAHATPGTNVMPRSANAASSAPDVSGDGGTGVGNGMTRVISQSSRTPRSRQVVVKHQRGLARRRRALERRPATPTIARPFVNVGQHVAQPLGAGHGVELVAALGEPGRRVQVVVGAERDDQDVGLVRAGVRRHAPRFRVDRRDRLLQETHPGLTMSRRAAARPRASAAEHHVELREAEDERVALVDQGELDVVAERFRQHVASSSPPKPAPRTTTRVGTDERNASSASGPTGSPPDAREPVGGSRSVQPQFATPVYRPAVPGVPVNVPSPSFALLAPRTV